MLKPLFILQKERHAMRHLARRFDRTIFFTWQACAAVLMAAAAISADASTVYSYCSIKHSNPSAVIVSDIFKYNYGNGYSGSDPLIYSRVVNQWKAYIRRDPDGSSFDFTSAVCYVPLENAATEAAVRTQRDLVLKSKSNYMVIWPGSETLP